MDLRLRGDLRLRVDLRISQYISVILSLSMSRRRGAGLAECVGRVMREAGQDGPQHDQHGPHDYTTTRNGKSVIH